MKIKVDGKYLFLDEKVLRKSDKRRQIFESYV